MKRNILFFSICALFILFTSCGIPNIYSLTWSDYSTSTVSGSAYDLEYRIRLNNSALPGGGEFNYKAGFPRLALFYQILPNPNQVSSGFSSAVSEMNNTYCNATEGMPFFDQNQGVPFVTSSYNTSYNEESEYIDYGVFQFRKPILGDNINVTENNEAVVYPDLNLVDNQWNFAFDLDSNNGVLNLIDLNDTEDSISFPIQLLRYNGTNFTNRSPESTYFGSNIVGNEISENLASLGALSNNVDYQLAIYVVVQAEFSNFNNTSNTTLRQIGTLSLTGLYT